MAMQQRGGGQPSAGNDYCGWRQWRRIGIVAASVNAGIEQQ